MLEIKSREMIFVFGVFQDCAWIFEKRGKKKLQQRGETLQHLLLLQRTCCLSELKPCFSFILLLFFSLDLSHL
jgi:hypothetical protein